MITLANIAGLVLLYVALEVSCNELEKRNRKHESFFRPQPIVYVLQGLVLEVFRISVGLLAIVVGLTAK